MVEVDEKGVTVNSRTKKLVGALVSLLLACSVAGLGGCYRSTESLKADAPTKETIPEKKVEENGTSSSKSKSVEVPIPEPAPRAEQTPEPEYEDSRWPTSNQALLDIPESQRWYNAWDQAWTNCTVVGPVKEVYQAKDSYGMPIFVDIGEAYPGPNRVTLVIWAESLGDFEEMLYAVDDGGAWLSVTGYLSVYNDTLQFNIDDGPVSFQWWTQVK